MEHASPTVTGGLLHLAEQVGDPFKGNLLNYLSNHHFTGVILDQFNRWLRAKHDMTPEDLNTLAEHDVIASLDLLIMFADHAKTDQERWESLARCR